MSSKDRSDAEVLRLGCLISGGGRTVLNLAEAIERWAIPARIEVVLAHRESIPGVERCREAGLPVRILTIDDHPDTESIHDRIDRMLEHVDVDLVCLAGYLRHFRVADRWNDRVINIHPSLLPRHGGPGMYGNKVHAAVLAAGDSRSGCTVHAVDEIYDHGAVIHQIECPVLPDDTAVSLADRVFKEECRALPEVIRAWSKGEVSIEGGILRGSVASHC